MEVVLEADLRGGQTEAMHHGSNHLTGRGVVRKTVGIGKQISLQGLCAGVQIGNQRGLTAGIEEIRTRCHASLFDARGNVEDAGTFGNGHRARVDVSMDDAAVDFGYKDGVCEPVLAGTEPAPQNKAQKIEGILAADDARLFKLCANAHRRGAGGQLDKGFGLRAVGRNDQPRGHSSQTGNCAQHQQ